METPLIRKQQAFARLLPKLLTYLFEQGYEVTMGEMWRPPEMAEIYKKQGKGITNSLHWIRLAVDLVLWKDLERLTLTEQYRSAGEYWESLSTNDVVCCWGGRFGDGNHFSVTNGGVK